MQSLVVWRGRGQPAPMSALEQHWSLQHKALGVPAVNSAKIMLEGPHQHGNGQHGECPCKGAPRGCRVLQTNGLGSVPACIVRNSC